MSLDLLTETILTFAGPLLFVGSVWALAVWALNFSDARTQWYRRFIPASPTNPKPKAARPFKDKPRDTSSNI
ncbi:hypothetical protein HYPDE_23373 [Hyphomicrobium denitrificans 1NES1]|uniref:Uncharacterized protein n=1 Tax=Hyphomicrobium denitrificans 1NES1 TaxID=670307 RepID=N0B737_9HYPH|nr:hypothetical protein HYPDE_23373 [Hyphomicrobium denitrificans 1NES1]